LRKSAKKLVEKPEDAAELEKLNDLVENGQLSSKQADEVIEELYEVAEKTRNAGKYTIQNEGVISIANFNKIVKRIKEEYGVDMFLVDRNSEQWAELFRRWQKKPLQGMWVDQPLVSKNYDVPLEIHETFVLSEFVKAKKYTKWSCRREFVMLEDYLKTQGKKVKFVVFSDETIKGTEDLKIALKLKKKK